MEDSNDKKRARHGTRPYDSLGGSCTAQTAGGSLEKSRGDPLRRRSLGTMAPLKFVNVFCTRTLISPMLCFASAIVQSTIGHYFITGRTRSKKTLVTVSPKCSLTILPFRGADSTAIDGGNLANSWWGQAPEY